LDCIEILRKLSSVPGPSGFESRIRALISDLLTEWGFHYEVDRLGNLYVKVGEGRPVTAIAAHMDEVGFIVRHVTRDGFLRVAPLGGINPSAAIGSQVVVLGRKRDLYGVVGATPPHLLKNAEQRQVSIEDLFVDIGALSHEEVLKAGVTVGTPIAFWAEFHDLGSCVAGRAFDDRAGCAVLLEALKRAGGPRCGTVFVVFTVQEEVGLIGSSAAAQRIMPDCAVAVEGTIASDVPGVPEHEWVTRLGSGPAIRVMDKTLVACSQLVEHIRSLAESHGIPYQLQLSPKSGTDAGSFVRIGAASTAVSVPCRYVHSPVAVASKSDLENTASLLRLLIDSPPGARD